LTKLRRDPNLSNILTVTKMNDLSKFIVQNFSTTMTAEPVGFSSPNVAE